MFQSKPLGARHGRDGIGAACARVFLLITLPAAVLLCFLIPPLEGADEVAHFLRVVTVSNGQVLPQVMRHDPAKDGGPSTGGEVDTAVADFVGRLAKPHPYTPANVRAMSGDRATGHARYVDHSNTAIYTPVTYLPSAAAAMLAKAAGLPVLWWFYAARLAGALAAVAILFGAIRLGGDVAPSLLVAGTLPVVLYQGAVLTTDTLLIPSVLLFGVMTRRLATNAPMTPARHGLAIATLFVIALSKIAYLPLVILPAIAARLGERRWGPRARLYIAGAGAATLLWLAWSWIIRDKVFPLIPGIHVDTPAQLHFLLHEPARAIGILSREMVVKFAHLLVGVPGLHLGRSFLWGPKILAPIALAALMASAVPAARPGRVPMLLTAAALALATCCYVATFLLLYLQWNAVASPTVEGVQPRYLTPLVFLLIATTPRLAIGERGMQVATRACMAWSGVSALITVIYTIGTYWRL